MKLNNLIKILLVAIIVLCATSCADEKLPNDIIFSYEQGGNEQAPDPITNVKVITVNGVSFKMIKVEAGTFTMGATSEQTGA